MNLARVPVHSLRLFASSRLTIAAMLVLAGGCRPGHAPVDAELPPGLDHLTGAFRDIAPRWSHDGSRIAFLRATGDRRYQLCLAGSDLSHVFALLPPEVINPDRRLRTGRTGWRCPERLAWSPDNRYIAFPRVEWFTFDDGEKLAGTGIWTFDTQTGRVEPLALHPTHYAGAFYFFRSPEWSPDGTTLAYIGEGLHGETALFVRAISGESPTAPTPRFDSYLDTDWPAWAPSGGHLVFRQGILRSSSADPIETVRVIQPGGSEARRLFATTPGRYMASLSRPVQLADVWGLPRFGRAAAAELDGEPDAERQSVQIASTALAPVAPRVTGFAWSPDGSRLAFALTPNAIDPGRCTVWVTPVHGPGRPRQIGGWRNVGLLAPEWLDEERLAALHVSSRRGQPVCGIEVADVDGGAWREVVPLPDDDFDWSPSRRWIAAAGPAMAPGKARSGQNGLASTLRLLRVD